MWHGVTRVLRGGSKPRIGKPHKQPPSAWPPPGMDPVAVLERLACLLDGDAVLSVRGLSVVPEPSPAAGGVGPVAGLRVSEGHVGLSSWALPLLYAECKRRLAVSGHSTSARIAACVLAVQPDHGRAWAIRKRALSDAGARASKRELAFCALVLGRAPKCGGAWDHRAWVLARAGWDARAELSLARAAAGRVQANYYAGVHLMRALERADSGVVEEEIGRSREWLQTHVSDASGWWFHAVVVRTGREMGRLDASEETAFVEDMHKRYGEVSQCVRLHWRLWRRQAEDLGHVKR